MFSPRWFDASVSDAGQACRRGNIVAPMKKLLQAPNLVLATLWADQLSSAGITASVQRAYASSINGTIPPDQSLPEVWIDDAAQFDLATALLAEWHNAPHRTWACSVCHEIVEGPFEHCWNCGAAMPAP
jgi:hypothetical protein